MRAAKSKLYGATRKGEIARFFGMKDDSHASFAVEILGGITMFLTSLALFDLAKSPEEILKECRPNTPSLSDARVTEEAMATALATGIATLLMGLIARIPVVVGPSLAAALSLEKLFCQASYLSTASILAANLIVGLCYTAIIILARRFNLFAGIPEDFRLGMAGGICALIGIASTFSVSLIHDRSVVLDRNSTIFYAFSPQQKNNALRVPLLAGMGLVMLVVIQVRFTKRVQIALGSLATIIIIALLSNIIRATTFPEVYDEYKSYVVSSNPNIGMVPSFEGWNSTSGYFIFRYVLTNTVEKLYNSFATVSAIALLLVVSKLGYNKAMFVQAINDSEKITRALMVDAISNVFLTPFLGTVIIQPYVESIGGIIAGTKTGLGACVAGILYIAVSPCIRYVSLVFPHEAISPSVIYASIFAVRCIQYVDFRRPANYFPALLVFIFIPVSFEIGVSSSVAFVLLFCSWLFTKHWICINPQMLVNLGLSVSLIIFRASIGRNTLGLGIIVITVALLCLVLGLVLFLRASRTRLKRWCGNDATDVYFDNDPRTFLEARFGALPGPRRATNSTPPSMNTAERAPSNGSIHSPSFFKRGSHIFSIGGSPLQRKRRLSNPAYSSSVASKYPNSSQLMSSTSQSQADIMSSFSSPTSSSANPPWGARSDASAGNLTRENSSAGEAMDRDKESLVRGHDSLSNHREGSTTVDPPAVVDSTLALS